MEKTEGALALINDVLGPDANPYLQGSPQYDAWLEGWTEAKDASDWADCQ